MTKIEPYMALLNELGFQCDQFTDTAFSAFYEGVNQDWNKTLSVVMANRLLRIDYTFYHANIIVCNQIMMDSVYDMIWVLSRSKQIQEHFTLLHEKLCKMS